MIATVLPPLVPVRDLEILKPLEFRWIQGTMLRYRYNAVVIAPTVNSISRPINNIFMFKPVFVMVLRRNVNILPKFTKSRQCILPLVTSVVLSSLICILILSFYQSIGVLRCSNTTVTWIFLSVHVPLLFWIMIGTGGWLL
jgi:hypothetical protein